MANEKRLLIYYDDLVVTLAKQYGATMDTHIYSPRDILSSMQGLSYVDAVEVKHGRWIEKIDIVASYLAECEELFYECSACNAPNFGETPYCPNCGASMKDGDGNG